MTKHRRFSGVAHVQLTAAAMIEIGEKIDAERAEWPLRLGVPRGLQFPPKPMPTTWETLEAELSHVDRIATETLQARMRTPEGERDQRYEGLGFAMIRAQDRRWNLQQLRKQWQKAQRRARFRLRRICEARRRA